MNQLTNEEIAKVFVMYLNDTAKVQTKDGAMNLVAVDIFNQTVDVCESYDSVDPNYENLQEVKLLLKPLSSISDEDAVEVAKMAYRGEQAWEVQNGKQLIQFISTDDPALMSGLLTICIYQYLISKGYAVPLFFGVNHWANGKTAHELGVAIELNK